MAVKLFIFGLPGCGKSEIARKIQTYVEQKRWLDTDRYWSAERFNDYPILDDMSKDETEGKFFQRLDREGGFDVLNIVAFDMALPRLEQKIKDHISPTKPEEMILIEFSRNDYWRAFDQFDRSFLQDACYIYLGAKIDVCRQRIIDRTANPQHKEDDYFISEYIFREYYNRDDGYMIDTTLQDVFDVGPQRRLVLDNNCSLKETLEKVRPFIDVIIKHTMAPYYKEASSLSEFSIASQVVDKSISSSKELEPSLESKGYQLIG